MSHFEWSDAYRLQVKAMDDEHHMLIAMMNRLHGMNENKESKENLIKQFEGLVKFCTKHFNDEEAYMESFGFEDLAMHKGVHKNLLDELNVHLSAFKKNHSKFISDSVFTFLNFWLKSHIMGMDKKCAQQNRMAS